MSTLAFDTHPRVKQLVKTGVTEAQAEAFVDVVAGATVLPDVSQLATKSDLAVLASDVLGEINAVRGEIGAVRGEIGAVRGEINGVRGEIDGVRGEIDGIRGEINGLRGEMKGLKGELIWWIIGCFGLNAGISLSVAISQLLAHLPK